MAAVRKRRKQKIERTRWRGAGRNGEKVRFRRAVRIIYTPLVGRRYASRWPSLFRMRRVRELASYYLLQLFKGDSSGSYSRHLVRDSCLCRSGLFKATWYASVCIFIGIFFLSQLISPGVTLVSTIVSIALLLRLGISCLLSVQSSPLLAMGRQQQYVITWLLVSIMSYYSFASFFCPSWFM